MQTLPGTSHVRHVNLGQDRVEAIFIEAMQKNSKLSFLQRIRSHSSF
jgi:phenol 2-monooxygenase